jgi:hypothetical protein
MVRGAVRVSTTWLRRIKKFAERAAEASRPNVRKATMRHFLRPCL